MNKTHFLPWFIFIFLALVWGSSFILIKKALVVFSPFQVANLRVSAAVLVMLLVSAIFYKRFSSRKWHYLLLSGLLGVFIPAFLFAVAQTHIESAVTGTLNALTPLFTLIIGVLFFNQKTGIIRNTGVLIGFIGAVSLILLSSQESKFEIDNYAFLVILATVLYGININFIKVHLQDLEALHISAVSVLLLAPFTFSGLFWSDVPQTYEAKEGSFVALASVLGLGVLSTGFASILFNKLLQISSPLFTSSVTYFIPIIAVLWGLADGETLGLGHYFSMLVIILGVWLVNAKR